MNDVRSGQNERMLATLRHPRETNEANAMARWLVGEVRVHFSLGRLCFPLERNPHAWFPGYRAWNDNDGELVTLRTHSRETNTIKRHFL